jgi:S-adenosylmethionine:tRNA-ribosyltransferase-isomerase (queuine synthetase)
MMLTSAFLDSVEFTNEIYDEAIKNEYNFLCYGDALLII